MSKRLDRIMIAVAIVALLGISITSWMIAHAQQRDAKRADTSAGACQGMFAINMTLLHDAERALHRGEDDGIVLAQFVGGMRSTLVLCFPADHHQPHPATLLLDLDRTTPPARLTELATQLDVGWRASTIGEPWHGSEGFP